MWMQSEPCCPRIILSYIRGRAVKRAPQIAIPSCGPSGPACRPQAFSFLHAKNYRLEGCHMTMRSPFRNLIHAMRIDRLAAKR